MRGIDYVQNIALRFAEKRIKLSLLLLLTSLLVTLLLQLNSFDCRSFSVFNTLTGYRPYRDSDPDIF